MSKFVSARSQFRAAARASAALSSLALALCLPAAAFAQDAADEDAEDEIVVTGTLIRGSAPVGSNSLVIGQAKLEETAALSSNDLLASIPQVTNYFNKLAVSDLSIEVTQIQISRPNLRNISPNNAASSGTLILVDGHRVATAGVNQASVDPDLIPVGAIQRVDVVTEGGSATYGTDAVAGVINFITRRRFDGVEIGAHYGFADDYYQWDAKATVGKDWGTGSLWASYSFSKNDMLFGRERDYIRNVNYATQPYVGRDLTCSSPNLSLATTINADPAQTQFNATTYATPALVANTRNICDNSEDATRVPRAERHGIVVGLSQDLGSRTSIDVRGYYSQRKTLALSDLTGTVAIGPNNPVATLLPPGLVVGPTILFGFFPATTSALGAFNLRPLLGDGAKRSTTNIRQWGANAELRHDLNDSWQVRALVNWGQSHSSFASGQISPARLTAAGVASTAATAINPLFLSQNNAALIADLVDSVNAGETRNSMFNARLIAEGKLFTLPGGDLRLAIGAEYLRESLQKRSSPDVRIGGLSNLPYAGYARNVKSLFGEVQAPLIANGEGDPMLTLSAALRYDDYSDFGHTTNPKLGATFKPVHWLTIRGNWGKSFTAPTPLDQLGSLSNFTSYNTFVAFKRIPDDSPSGSGTAAIQGALPGLQPQTAKTWSIGADIEPMQGLRLSANYYAVDFSNILRTPFSNTPFTDYPGNYSTKATGFTPAEVAAFFGNTPGAAATIASIGTQTVYELVDFRTGNFGVLKVRGLDASLSYSRETGFGGVDFAVNANIPLRRKAQISTTSAVVDELKTENPKLYLQTTLGANVGNFRAQATLNHTSGYNIAPITNIAVPQSHVGSFSVVNLFFKYDVPGESMLLKDLSITLNIDNVFDTNPPQLRRNNNNEYGYANGFTLGRMVILGVSKKF